ncbi:MAG: ATP-binding protein [Acidobacteriota bacterium]|nr:ATP-binding protein [Acidobacteriota bacterium]MDE3266673.1 ATP-binding protein [Acidobacteriota bacterium]
MKSATFTVDAALLQELGERLIGRSYIALAELLKNSYDADATDCRIEFRDDEIIVSDNGHGMSEREFHEHWMRLGTTHKSVDRESRRFGRPMTGSKGIGRLSVQFLADEMTLESTAADDPSRHLYAFVDWKGVRRGEDLETVNVLWEMRDGPIPCSLAKRSCTRIVLKKLKSEWGTAEIEKLGQDIWLLRPPFGRPPTGSADRSALDFFIDIDAPRIKNAKEVFDRLQDALLQNWKAKITGRLQDGRTGGEASVEVLFNPGYPEGLEARASFRESLALPVKTSEDGGTRIRSASALDRTEFEILIFKTAGKQPGGVPVSQMRDYLHKFGNVSVYDSGFRIPYYGSSQDWLDVARDQGRRLIASELLPARLNLADRYLLDLPAPGRIFGSVEIDTNHERALAESAGARPGSFLQLSPGRDRLADNAGFEQLRDLVRFSLDFYASRYRLLAVQAAEKRRAGEVPSRTFRRAVTVLDRNRDEMPRAVFRDVRKQIVAAEKASKRVEEEVDRRAVLLAPLATAGMTALALNHELAREAAIVGRLADRLTTAAEELEAPELTEIATGLLDASMRFRALQELFAPLVSEEDREATSRLRVAPIVDSVVRAMRPIMPGCSFEALELPGDLRLPVGSFADWNAVLQNLLSNAWNASLDAEEASIAFDGGRRGRYREWLRVSDAGVGLGVPLEEAPTLFEPFERRLYISHRNRSVAMGGQGLGLALVRLIAERRSVRAAFVKPRRGFSTSIELSWKGAGK